MRWAALATLVVPGTLGAQEPADREALQPEEGVRLVGDVVGRPDGEAIVAAEVVLASFDPEGPPAWSGVTDSDGGFRTDLVPPGPYLLRVDVPEYATISELLIMPEPGTVDARIEMVPLDFELDPIVVTARRRTRLDEAGFYERRASGGGTFFTRDEILERSPFRLEDVLRRVPGLRVVAGSVGSGDSIRMRGGCVPDVYMDGAAMAQPVEFAVLPDPEDLQAIEVHRGASVPPVFRGPSGCGAIVLWTRDPRGGETGTVRSLLTVLGGAALIALAAVLAG